MSFQDHYHQPAISPYAPASRNTFLHRPCDNQNKYHKKKIALVALYVVLKFWDSPVLQKAYYKLTHLWNNSLRLLSKNERIDGIFNTTFAFKADRGVKKLGWLFARCLVEAIERLRLNKVGILSVPVSLHQWVLRKTDNYDDNVMGENIVQIEIKDYIDVGCGDGNNTITVKELQYHGEQIDNVLKFWFGQYSPDKAQKYLWMIASSSKEQLDKVDAEITKTYASLLSDLVAKEELRSLWCGYDGDTSDHHYSIFGWRGKLAAIILLDQMSRHIHRYIKTNRLQNGGVGNHLTIPNQEVLDTLAFEISQTFQHDHITEISSGMVPTPMIIFALMPYRHASTLQTVGFVQSKVEDIAIMNSVDMNNMIRRFRTATNRRMAVLQDEARRTGRKTLYDAESTNNDEDKANEVPIREFSDDDILEFQPFIADMSDANNHILVRTIISFLAGRGIHPVKQGSNCIKDTPVVVSLSGGVDSMVIARVLAFLRDNCGYNQLYLAAVHVDYGNRPESSAEAAFVKNYALNVMRFDDCVVRRIDEVTRGVTKRDEYEQVSRNVRYDLYKIIIAKCIQICTMDQPDRVINEVGVMLGHHRGDVVENVISNSNKGCGPLDLSGMTTVSQNDGVTMYRPLLPLNKEDVFHYSHKYGVPYFKDTTPHWSTRGKLRNKLIPLLEEVYGDGCLNNLAKLAQESDEAKDLFNCAAFRPFMDTVIRSPMGVIFSTGPFKSQGSYFWKIVLRDLLHSIGLGMFSDKSIESFLDRVFSKKIKSGWLQCRKDYAVYLMDDGRVMVLDPTFFPWRKCDEFKIEDRIFHVGTRKSIGPWTISAEIVSANEDSILLKKKAIQNIEDLMSGEINYYLYVLEKVTGEIHPLTIVDSFCKETRPVSWKNCDLKVEETLPILGNDVETTKLLADSTALDLSTRLVKICLKLDSSI